MDNEFWRYRPYRGVREFVEEVQARTKGLLETSSWKESGVIEYMPIERQRGGRKYTFLMEGTYDVPLRGFTVYEIEMRPRWGADFTGLIAWTREDNGVGVFSLGLNPDVHPRAKNSRFRMTDQRFCFREMELWGEEIGIVPRWEGQYLRDVAEVIGGTTRWDNEGWVRDM